ncbi:MAG: hypothetical protein IJP66_00105 [Kiritimatiellae bacterium]|nr:hypothetical protein [Kiritimatiellia bacterium]
MEFAVAGADADRTITSAEVALPEIAFANSDGTAASSGAWKFALADEGAKITLSCQRAFTIVVR